MFNDDPKDFDFWVCSALLKSFSARSFSFPFSVMIRSFLYALVQGEVLVSEMNHLLIRHNTSLEEISDEYRSGFEMEEKHNFVKLVCSVRLYRMAEAASIPYSLPVVIFGFMLLFSEAEYSLYDVFLWEKGRYSPHGSLTSFHDLLYRPHDGDKMFYIDDYF